MQNQKQGFVLKFAKLHINFQSCQVHSQKQSEPANHKANSSSLPFSRLPGPSFISLLFWYLPGGVFHDKDHREVVNACRKKYGDIYKIPSILGTSDMLFIHDPAHLEKVFRTEGHYPGRPNLNLIQYYQEIVRPDLYGKYKGLLSSQGQEWGEIRKLVNPLMVHPKNAKIYLPTIDKVADEFLQRMRRLRHPSSNQLPDDFETELNGWALETMAAVGLGVRLGLVTDKPTTRSLEFLTALKVTFELAYELSMRLPVWKVFATPAYKEFVNAMDTITEIVIQYVAHAKKATNSDVDCESQSILHKLIRIDEDAAVGVAMSIMFSGVDTISTALASVLYSLAKNPDKQEILRKELRTIMPEKNSPHTTENMNNLPYLRACIKESLRILPTVSCIVRKAGRNLVLNGYEIPEGTNIAMMCTQETEKYYERTSEFVPERWLKRETSIVTCPLRTKLSHPFIYLPFGFGPRMCIGRRFADMEIEVMTSKIVRNFNIGWEQSDLIFKQRFVNVPEGKLSFTLQDVA